MSCRGHNSWAALVLDLEKAKIYPFSSGWKLFLENVENTTIKGDNDLWFAHPP